MMDIQNTISIIGIAISLCTSIIAIFLSAVTLATTIKISNNQKRKHDIDYLTNALIVPYNKIEADIIMLSDGRNTFLDHDQFDKEVLNGICISKSYALLIDNMELFNYLDGLITGEAQENMGKFIEDYFKARNEMMDQTSDRTDITKGEKLRDDFLGRCRKMRDDTISSISSFLK